jgi:hypothetical protein
LTIASLYKTIAAALILLAVLAQTFNKSFIVAGYYANTQAYAKSCENKAKPQMQCNGKCQMMKKIQAEEKKNQDGSERKTDNKIDLQFFVQVDGSVIATVTVCLPNNILYYYQNNATVERHADIFHPPQAGFLRIWVC